MGVIKVALICHLSNEVIRGHLRLKNYLWKNSVKRILGRIPFSYSDYGTWNTISLNEYGKYSDFIEIHAIVPHPGMKDEYVNFKDKGIYYHCFSQSDNSRFDYVKNRSRISYLIDTIEPDLVCIVGIETPFYSLSVLDLDVKKIPVVACMQTALSDPDFPTLYPIEKHAFESMLACEQRVLKHVQYIASDVEWHRLLARGINPTANFVRYYFCTDTSLRIEKTEKTYDFVYWASNIEKAGMDAFKAFSIACFYNRNLTLNMVGSYSNDFYGRLMAEVKNRGLEKNVVLSGYYPSHEEAIKQVQKSRFALVPVKIDIISTTIREAALMRMPIVTFITKGTPSMNREKQCVLLSEIGDYEDMAKNMLRLVEDEDLCESLAQNSYEFAKKAFDNEMGAQANINMFMAVYNHFFKGLSLPDEIKKAWL